MACTLQTVLAIAGSVHLTILGTLIVLQRKQITKVNKHVFSL